MSNINRNLKGSRTSCTKALLQNATTAAATTASHIATHECTSTSAETICRGFGRRCKSSESVFRTMEENLHAQVRVFNCLQNGIRLPPAGSIQQQATNKTENTPKQSSERFSESNVILQWHTHASFFPLPYRIATASASVCQFIIQI